MVVVLDTNIFIDALFNLHEECNLILRREHSGEFTIIMSNSMSEELINILERSMDKMNTDDYTKTQIFKILLRAMRRVQPIEPSIHFKKCEDSSDNKFFECAIDGNADYLVSRDSHIHRVKEKTEVKNKNGKVIKIMYPDEFIADMDRIKLSLHFNGKIG